MASILGLYWDKNNIILYSFVITIGSTVGLVTALYGWKIPILISLAALVITFILFVIKHNAARKLWMFALGLLLLGYAFFGRGFAYLGVAPLYIGEIVLFLGVFIVLLTGGFGKAFNSKISRWLIVLFVFGIISSIPYFGQYGIDVLRDSVLYGYGAYSILIVACILKNDSKINIHKQFNTWLNIYLLWLPFAYIIQRVAKDALPTTPGSDVSFIYLKPGDCAVILAGIGAFLMLGLNDYAKKRRNVLIEWFQWLLWIICSVMVTAANRGGMLAIFTALMTVVILRVRSRWIKPVCISILLATLFMGLNIEIDLGMERKISFEQITNNAKSIFVEEGTGLTGTKEFRLSWWKTIIDYTFFGDYFWTGKGFGVNLADSDGYQVLADGSLRSPHNASLNFLARMGVPGFTVWVILQLVFAFSLLRAYFITRRKKEDYWSKMNLWTLAFWVAAIVNSMFDVYLEGPQGGIWFWGIFGVGIAILETQKKRGILPISKRRGVKIRIS